MDYSNLTKADIVELLSIKDPIKRTALQKAAEETLFEKCGPGIYLRGLVEQSNICRCDCHYCGIRKSNKKSQRYELTEGDLLNVAQQCVDLGFASMVIQAGERHDAKFISFMEQALQRIKKETTSKQLPKGLGITISLGEHTKETYQRWFNAGAHRYLLRVETTNPDLFAKLHPPEQSFKARVQALRDLRDIGYQVGTGVMIGLPGQTVDDLANDILFFKKEDIDMIGMGPFIPHADTPMSDSDALPLQESLEQTLLMIGTTRLVLQDVNIAATTALEAIDPKGRDYALQFGANVMMPLLTPESVCGDYNLYPGKPKVQNKILVKPNVTGRHYAFDEWGDSQHALLKVME